MEHVIGLGGHAGQVHQRLDQGIGSDHEGDVGDPLGVVGDALQLGGDLQDRGKRAQVLGHGLLRGDQGERLVLDCVTALVDDAVTFDEAVGPGEVWS